MKPFTLVKIREGPYLIATNQLTFILSYKNSRQLLWDFGASVLDLYSETSPAVLVRNERTALAAGAYDDYRVRICSRFSIPDLKEGASFTADKARYVYSDAELLKRKDIRLEREFVQIDKGDDAVYYGEVYLVAEVRDVSVPDSVPSFWVWVHNLIEVSTLNDNGEVVNAGLLTPVYLYLYERATEYDGNERLPSCNWVPVSSILGTATFIERRTNKEELWSAGLLSDNQDYPRLPPLPPIARYIKGDTQGE